MRDDPELDRINYSISGPNMYGIISQVTLTSSLRRLATLFVLTMWWTSPRPFSSVWRPNTPLGMRRREKLQKKCILLFRYGGRATTTECPTAIVMMCVQSVIGIFIEVRYLATPVSSQIRFERLS